MPFKRKEDIFFTVSSYGEVRPDGQTLERHSRDRNDLVYVASGSCSVHAFGRESRVSQRTLVYIARDVKYRIQAEARSGCRLQVLELTPGGDSSCLNLFDLCAGNPLVDLFMRKKSRCCILVDNDAIFAVINSLFDELDGEQSEKRQMVTILMTMLYIKIARSYSLQGQPASVRYISDARRYIEQHYSQRITVQDIADHLGISRSYLQILFGRYLKSSVVTHINGIRIDKAAYLLATTKMSVLDIALATGYNSRQHFTRSFRERTGFLPREYRKRRMTPVISQIQ